MWYHAFLSLLGEAVSWLCHDTTTEEDSSDRRLLDRMCPLFRFGLLLAVLSAAYFLAK